MTELQHFFTPNLSDLIGDAPPQSIVSRTFYEDERMKAILFGFAAGQELSEHTAARPAILHFIQGEAELTLGEQRMSVSAGAWAHMPPRLPHSIVAKTRVIMLLMLV